MIKPGVTNLCFISTAHLSHAIHRKKKKITELKLHINKNDR